MSELWVQSKKKIQKKHLVHHFHNSFILKMQLLSYSSETKECMQWFLNDIIIAPIYFLML